MMMAAALLAMAAGCGRRGTVPLGPAEVVVAFTQAVAAGRTAEAMELCDSSLMKGYIQEYAHALSDKAALDSAATSIATGILSEIRITVTDMSKAKGSRTVFYTVENIYGDHKDKIAEVKEEEGEWKVTEIRDRN